MREQVIQQITASLIPELERRRVTLERDGLFSRVTLERDLSRHSALLWSLRCFPAREENWTRLSLSIMAAVLVTEIGLSGWVMWELPKSRGRASSFTEYTTKLVNGKPGSAMEDFTYEVPSLFKAFDRIAGRAEPPLFQGNA